MTLIDWDYSPPVQNQEKQKKSTPLFHKINHGFPTPDFDFYLYAPSQFVSKTHQNMNRVYGRQIYKHLLHWGFTYMNTGFRQWSFMWADIDWKLDEVFIAHCYDLIETQYLGNFYEGDTDSNVMGIMPEHMERVCRKAAMVVAADWSSEWYEKKQEQGRVMGQKSKRGPVIKVDEVLRCLRAGMTDKATAERLGCDVRTISRKKKALTEQGAL